MSSRHDLESIIALTSCSRWLPPRQVRRRHGGAREPPWPSAAARPPGQHPHVLRPGVPGWLSQLLCAWRLCGFPGHAGQALQPHFARYRRLPPALLRKRVQHHQEHSAGAVSLQVQVVLRRGVQDVHQVHGRVHLQMIAIEGPPRKQSFVYRVDRKIKKIAHYLRWRIFNNTFYRRCVQKWEFFDITSKFLLLDMSYFVRPVILVRVACEKLTSTPVAVYSNNHFYKALCKK